MTIHYCYDNGLTNNVLELLNYVYFINLVTFLLGVFVT